MSLTPVYKPIVEITEILRNNRTDNLDALMKELNESYTRLSALL